MSELADIIINTIINCTESNSMPVRKIPKNYSNVTGIASRSKAIGQAMFESTLERDFITLLEFNSNTKSFEVQPLTIEWRDEKDKSRKYTPDILAFFKPQNKKLILYEVKYRNELSQSWPELRPKFKAAIKYARNKG